MTDPHKAKTLFDGRATHDAQEGEIRVALATQLAELRDENCWLRVVFAIAVCFDMALLLVLVAMAWR